MRTTFISSAVLWNSPRSSLDKLQDSLVKANTELVTGRHSDVGLALGYKVGETLSLRQQLTEIEGLVASNTSVTMRLEATSKMLSNMREVAEGFRNGLVGLPPGGGTTTIIKKQAEAHLSNLISDLNTNVAGQFIFGGTNTKEKPINNYSGDGTPPDPKAEVASAFFAEFGFNQSDPLVSEITPDKMTDFLNGVFDSAFTDEIWKEFSNASSQNIKSRVSVNETVTSSANANELAIRKAALAYVVISDLGIESLSEETKKVVISKAIDVLGQSVAGLIEIEAELGTSQEKLNRANERFEIQKTIFEKKVGALEAVDPAEAKVRVDQLMTQIQTSYSLTAQLRQLSLVNFI